MAETSYYVYALKDPRTFPAQAILHRQGQGHASIRSPYHCLSVAPPPLVVCLASPHRREVRRPSGLKPPRIPPLSDPALFGE